MNSAEIKKKKSIFVRLHFSSKTFHLANPTASSARPHSVSLKRFHSCKPNHFVERVRRGKQNLDKTHFAFAVVVSVCIRKRPSAESKL